MSSDEILSKIQNSTTNLIYKQEDIKTTKIDKETKSTSFVILSDDLVTIGESVKAITEHTKKYDLKKEVINVIIISSRMLEKFDKQSDGKFSQTLFSNTSNI